MRIRFLLESKMEGDECHESFAYKCIV